MAQLLSQVAVGTVVKINENGSPVEFYVAKHDYESGLNGAGRTLLVRKTPNSQRAWDSGNVADYANSDIDDYLNGSYFNSLDADIKVAIGTTEFEYTYGSDNTDLGTLERSVFLLSGTELGKSSSWLNQEGSRLPIYGTLLSAGVDYWTRSPYVGGTDTVLLIRSNGETLFITCNTTRYARPAFTLPETVTVNDDGTISTAPLAPATLTVPTQAMQSQPIAISWSAAEGADGYILERSADSGAWTQVYSGANTSYTDTAGAWTTVQYRVKAGLDGNYGEYTTSASVPVASASALTISGADGSLGTLTADVEFSVNTNTGNQIDLSYTVNGAQWYAGQVSGGYAGTIPVMELPTGNGTIVVTASVQATADKVTVTRTWTYNKTAAAFPAAGAVSQLSMGGVNQLPLTIAEAVRTTPFWGGDLGKALEMLTNSVQFYPNQTPKYQEVTVDLSTVSVGDIVQLPEDGVLVDYLVVHIGNPDAALYDASCDGVWLLRRDIVENGYWNDSNVNTLPDSTIMTTMAGHLSKFPAEVQTAIKTVKIPYCVGNGSATVNSGANGLECKIFPLSGYEVGLSQSISDALPIDGAKLDYFDTGNSTAAKQKRVAMQNHEAASWWLRSQQTTSYVRVYFIVTNGNYSQNEQDAAQYGIRLAFIMPTTFQATYYVDSSGTVHDAQEYTQGGETTDVQGNPINIGAKIATGSYVGTGSTTVGPEIDSDFEAKFAVVQGGAGTAFFVRPSNRADTTIQTANTKSAVLIATWSPTSLTWVLDGTTDDTDGDMLNAAGTTYYYLLLG